MTTFTARQMLLALLALLVLAACAAPPVPPPATAPVASASATPAPITPVASQATPPAPARRPPLGTFFFYWYNCPEQECDPAQVRFLPPGWITPLPNDPDLRDGASYSSYNYDWYEQELRTMGATGIDMVFPVSWGDHPHPWFKQDRIDLLVQANGVLEQPLQIGMFLDTTAQQGMFQAYLGNGYRTGPDVPRMPVSDPRSGYFFYDRHIRDFFRRVPRDMWATVNGRPIIITYTTICCDDIGVSGELWSSVKRAFAADFGVAPWLILEETWLSAPPPAGLPAAADVADGVYRWGTALNGPYTGELRGYRVSSVGPGFDNSRIPRVTEPRVQPRDLPPGGGPRAPGAFLRASLAAVPEDADLVLIETWNEWPEGTAVAPAAYTDASGRPLPADFYLRIIRAWKGQ